MYIYVYIYITRDSGYYIFIDCLDSARTSSI